MRTKYYIMSRDEKGGYKRDRVSQTLYYNLYCKMLVECEHYEYTRPILQGLEHHMEVDNGMFHFLREDKW